MKNESHETDLLSYARGGPGYQAHSETSRAAAANRPNAGAQREAVYNHIDAAGRTGATTDEVRTALLAQGVIHQNSIMSARVRELELAGRIVKTTQRRATSAAHQASVYVTEGVYAMGGFNRDISKGPPQRPVKQKGPRAKWFKLADWHEDIGPVLWHALPVQEPAFSGTPLDSDWPYEYTEKANLRWTFPPQPPER